MDFFENASYKDILDCLINTLNK